MLNSRFWSKVNKTKSCWHWIGCTNQGYGWYYHNRKPQNAHRLTYIERHGKIEDGFIVDHVCRNRACVNPDHLRLLKRGDNVLAGIGFSAINSRKAKCPNGHPYDLMRKNGERRCRTCKNTQERTAYTNKKEQINQRRRQRYALKLAKGELPQ